LEVDARVKLVNSPRPGSPSMAFQSPTPHIGVDVAGLWNMTGAHSGWSILRHIYSHVLSSPHTLAHVWMNDQGKDEVSLTYGQVWTLAVRVTKQLQKLPALQPPPPPTVEFHPASEGGNAALHTDRHRVLLCFSFGLEFICGFLGCLLANVIAVPVYAPNPSSLRKSLMKLHATIGACGARVALTDIRFNRFRQVSELGARMGIGEVASKAPPTGAELALMQDQSRDTTSLKAGLGWPKDLEWIEVQASAQKANSYRQKHAPEEFTFDQFPAKDVQASHVAFLQFSSGSTGLPKGVAITHRALLHNVLNLHTHFASVHQGEPIRFCSFLPPYHGKCAWMQSFTVRKIVILELICVAYGFSFRFRFDCSTFNLFIRWFERFIFLSSRIYIESHVMATNVITNESNSHWCTQLCVGIGSKEIFCSQRKGTKDRSECTQSCDVGK
jgi:acyl-CoA synthetase (AMP-forming)/AMP-acid ligase II